MDVLEEFSMWLVLRSAEAWLLRKLHWVVQTKWHGREPATVTNMLDKLRVIHKSQHFLAVNKHHDLVLNTNPPDTR